MTKNLMKPRPDGQFAAPRQSAIEPLRWNLHASLTHASLSNAGSGWMMEGSPQRLLRDYNALIEAYNRGVSI